MVQIWRDWRLGLRYPGYVLGIMAVVFEAWLRGDYAVCYLHCTVRSCNRRSGMAMASHETVLIDYLARIMCLFAWADLSRLTLMMSLPEAGRTAFFAIEVGLNVALRSLRMLCAKTIDAALTSHCCPSAPTSFDIEVGLNLFFRPVAMC